MATALMQTNRLESQDQSREVSESQEQLASFLGWFSIGLGLAEVLAPRALSQCLGIRSHPVLFPLLGLREIASGVGILTQSQPTGWLWGRVVGDAMDLALLGAAFLEAEESGRSRVAAATAAVAGIAALDALSAGQHTSQASS